MKLLQVAGLVAHVAVLLTPCDQWGVAAQDVPGWLDTSKTFEHRSKELLAQLTLEEKLGQLNSRAAAIDRLRVPAFDYWTGCAHGVADFTQQGATIFPMPLALAATFDQQLMLEVATVMGDETRAKANAAYQLEGKLLGTNCFDPNINIYRDPRWGRGAETFGEDPLLTARMVEAYVRGLQWGNISTSGGGQGDTYNASAATPQAFLKASATCKHYAAYSVEEFEGVTRMGFDAVIDPRDAEDTYLPAFEACVREGVGSIMCSYNAINGTPACANEWLLGQTLRGDWGFTGFVVSDCDAIEAISDQHAYAATPAEGAAAALKAGTDLACLKYDPLKDALAQGLVTQDLIDTATLRVLMARFRQGHFDHDPGVNPYVSISPTVVGQPSHLELARKAAAESIVLLKNIPLVKGPQGSDGSGDGAEPGAAPLLPLPLPQLANITVIGPLANQSELLLGNYYGNPAGRLPSPWDAITRRVSGFNTLRVTTDVAKPPAGVNYLRGSDVNDGGADMDEAVHSCRASDVCIFFLGTAMAATDRSRKQRSGGYDVTAAGTEGEAWDRDNLLLPGEQLSLVEAVAKRTNTPVVVVLVHGGPLDVSWMQEEPRVGAILTAWFPGQGADAIADVLFGQVSPSGRLPVSWYYNNYTEQVSFGDMHMRPWPGRTHRFLQVPVLYPFGYGLSYATFSHSIEVTPSTGTSRSGPAAPWADVTVTVTNEAGPDAEEAVLLFLSRQEPVAVDAANSAGSGVALLQSPGWRSGDGDVGRGSGTAAEASESKPQQLPVACVRLPDGADSVEGQPKQSLVAFDRVNLQPGESGAVTLAVAAGHFALFGEGTGEGRKPPCGRYWLRAGTSKLDIELVPDPEATPAA